MFFIKNILESNVPFNSNYNIDINIIKYGQTKSLTILKHIFSSAGFDYNYKEDKLQTNFL